MFYGASRVVVILAEKRVSVLTLRSSSVIGIATPLGCESNGNVIRCLSRDDKRVLSLYYIDECVTVPMHGRTHRTLHNTQDAAPRPRITVRKIKFG